MICATLFCFFTKAYAQLRINDDDLTAFVTNLINLNFQESGGSSFNQIPSDSNLWELQKTLYYRDSIIKYDLNFALSKNFIERTARLLAESYQQVHTTGNSPEVLTKLKMALNLSEDIGNNTLIKFCLFSLLEFYTHEILQSNHNYEAYIDQLGVMHKLPNEEFLLNLYRLLFYSHAKELPDDFYNVLMVNERLIDNSNISSALISRYEVQKAYGYEVKNMPDSAKFYYRNVIEKNKNLPFNKHLNFSSHLRLSQIAAYEKRYDDALSHIENAGKYINVSDTLKSKFYLHRFKSRMLANKGDFEAAYNDLKKSLDIEYDLDYKNNSLQISDLEVRLGTAEKEKQLLEEQQLSERRRNLLVAATVLILLGSGIALLINKNTTKKRLLAEKENIINRQKVDNLLKEQELVSIDAMIAGQEKERQKVANELHDDLGSLMATIKLHFDQTKTDERGEALQHAQNLLDEAYKKIRGMAHTKNSGVMSDQGLLPAVQKMAEVISKVNKLEILIEHYGMGERMDNSLELTIFRIIQELTTNILKHAEAKKANIQLTQHENNLNIIVEDNGKGFDYTKVKSRANGMGLTNIEKRIEHLEGEFSIDSIEGKGTSIIIDLPV